MPVAHEPSFEVLMCPSSPIQERTQFKDDGPLGHKIGACGDYFAPEGVHSAIVEDNAVQHTEFQRWKTLNLGSILDSYRPGDDHVDIDVRVGASERSRTMLVSMKSPFIGTRSTVQSWREHDGKWRFDALRPWWNNPAGENRSKSCDTESIHRYHGGQPKAPS